MESTVASITTTLQERSETDDATFLGMVADVFAPARSPDNAPQIEADYERCREPEALSVDGQERAQCGALGFALFCSVAEQWGRTHDPADYAQANALLDDARVRAFLFDLYEIEEEFRSTHLALHAVGTTSFIIKTLYVQKEYLRVLKIIKPWFFSVPVIAAQTRETHAFYERHLSHVTVLDDKRPIAPLVECSSRHYIVMKYVNGETLQQYFGRLWAESGARREGPGDDWYDAMHRLVRSLCALLQACHQASIAHGDLSSTNILVERTDAELPHLRLIDFGINYVLTTNLGQSDDARSLLATIDPDVMNRKYAAVPTVESDVYSLGVILTEGFLGERYRVESMQVLLDEVYDRNPGFGAILDDLLDPKPSRRLSGMSSGDDPYEYIASRIDFELRTVSSLTNVESNRPVNVLGKLVGIIVPGSSHVLDMGSNWIRGRQQRRSVLTPDARPRLGLPVREHADLVFPITLNILTVSIVLGWFAPWQDVVLGDAQLADALRDSGPAWIVVLTGSIVAAQYAISVVAGLVTTGIPRVVRASTMLCWGAPWIPLLLILFRYPDEWLLLVAIGASVVVANNCLWFWFCGKARKTIEAGEIRSSPLMDETKRNLGGWTETSVITLACVYLIAVLAARDLLHDITFYALVIAGVICPWVFYKNLSMEAPRIRTGLQRFSNAYRRAAVDPKRGGQRV
jgi:serine/threonine protein kinase